MKTPYSFVLIRYAHDVAVGEFVNIGVAVYCGDTFQFKIVKSTSRVIGMFPDLDIDNYIAVLDSLEKYFLALEDKHFHPATLLISIDSFVRPIPALLHDSFYITKTAFGFTSNPQSMLAHLYERYVAKHNSP